MCVNNRKVNHRHVPLIRTPLPSHPPQMVGPWNNSHLRQSVGRSVSYPASQTDRQTEVSLTLSVMCRLEWTCQVKGPIQQM